MAKGKKTGGRIKGQSTNIISRTLTRDIATALEGGRLQRLLKELDTLHGKEFVDAYSMLLRIVTPTLIAAQVEKRVTIEDALARLCLESGEE